MRAQSYGLFAVAAISLLALQGRAAAQLRSDTPQLLPCGPRIYVATGYALGNICFVVTDSNVVVIDTSESPEAAQQALAALRKVTPLPIRYLIYTHFHGDHVNGASSLKEAGTEVIAQRLHPREIAGYRLLGAYNRRLNAIQFGALLPPAERGIKLELDPIQPKIGYVEPDVLFDDRYEFTEGGVEFQLVHTTGETFDQLLVWLPQQKALFPGDLLYESFPMLASPMKPDRPVLAWAESIENMRSFHAERLIPSHGRPLEGAAHIDHILQVYAASIRHVHDETVRQINGGATLEEARQKVKLPPELAAEPYLTPLYGRVDWAVNGIYRQYTGWYDLNPTHLNPGPRNDTAQALLEAAGGAAPLLARAEKAAGADQHQLVLELTDVVLSAEPKQAEAHRLRAMSLRALAAKSINGVEKNVYLMAAQQHERAAKKGEP